MEFACSECSYSSCCSSQNPKALGGGDVLNVHVLHVYDLILPCILGFPHYHHDDDPILSGFLGFPIQYVHIHGAHYVLECADDVNVLP